MKIRKFLALLLAMAMLVCMFTACSKDEEEDDEDEKDEEKVEINLGDLTDKEDTKKDPDGNEPPVALRPIETQPVVDPEYPAEDFNNTEFTFLTIKHSDAIKDYYGGNYIDSEAICGERISDAVFQRNLAVGEKYKVQINERVEAGKNPNEVLDMYIRSGDFCFDAVYGWGYKMAACIPENYFADISTLPGVDLTKDYWAPSAVEDLTVNDSLYIAVSDISLNRVDWASTVIFNKNIYDDFNLEATYGDIYQLVRDGKWTLDKFLDMIKIASRDIDGDALITKKDIFGLLDGSANGANYLSGLGVNLTTKAADGSFELSFYNDKLLKIIDVINPVFSNSNYVKSYAEIMSGADSTGYDDIYQYARSIFTTDHCLFLTGAPNSLSETAFRNMESEYGIVPMPKYDEQQANYVSEVSNLASVFAVPSTPRNDIGSNERTGMILEYMSFKSNEILWPQYYNEILKGQRLDGDDAEMLDIIRDTTHYEFSSMAISYPNTTPYDVVTMMFTIPSAAASTYNSNKNKLQKELNEYFTKVLSLSVN